MPELFLLIFLLFMDKENKKIFKRKTRISRRKLEEI